MLIYLGVYTSFVFWAYSFNSLLSWSNSSTAPIGIQVIIPASISNPSRMNTEIFSPIGKLSFGKSYSIKCRFNILIFQRKSFSFYYFKPKRLLVVVGRYWS